MQTSKQNTTESNQENCQVISNISENDQIFKNVTQTDKIQNRLSNEIVTPKNKEYQETQNNQNVQNNNSLQKCENKQKQAEKQLSSQNQGQRPKIQNKENPKLYNTQIIQQKHQNQQKIKQNIIDSEQNLLLNKSLENQQRPLKQNKSITQKESQNKIQLFSQSQQKKQAKIEIENIAFQNMEELLKQIKKYVEQCKVQNIQNINQDIAICQETIQQLKSCKADESQILQFSEDLAKLIKLKSMKQFYDKNNLSEEEKLKIQFQQGLKELKIKQSQLQQTLKKCVNIKNNYIKKKNPRASQKQKQQNFINRLIQLKLKLKNINSSSNSQKIQQIKKDSVEENQIKMSQQFKQHKKKINQKENSLILKILKQNQILAEGIFSQQNTFSDFLNESKIQLKGSEGLTLENNFNKQKMKVNLTDKIISFYTNPNQKTLIGIIEQYFQVKRLGYSSKFYRKKTSLDVIKKDFKIRGNNYYFFDDNFKEYQPEQILNNIHIIQGQMTYVKYKGKLLKNKIVPLDIPVKDAIKYIGIDGPDSKFIQKIKINNIWIQIQPNSIINEVSNGNRLDQVQIIYKVNLKLQFLISRQQNQKYLTIKSNQPILQLKQKIEKKYCIKTKYQKLIYNQRQLQNQTTFQQFNQENFLISVEEIKNLQFYGFSTQQAIPYSRYRQFFVEDDEEFKNQINSSKFPDQDYQYSFRQMCLGTIFAAVKKHCRIKTALFSIKQLINQSNKKNFNLWIGRNSKQKESFNQHYVLNNILNSGDEDLRVQFMRVYKNHSPLPIIYQNNLGKKKNLKNNHYWISNPSFCVLSIQFLKYVKGKSNFLNKIFNTDFQLSTQRHPICSKSVYIKYNIYRDQNKLVDLIDTSSQSIDENQKIQFCKVANIIILHYHKQQIGLVEKWIKQNLKDLFIILVEAESNILQSQKQFKQLLEMNKKPTKIKKYGIPQLNQINSTYFSNKMNQISNQINQLIVNNLQAFQKSQTQWKLTTFFQQNNSILSSYTQKLKNLQDNFSNILDSNIIQKSSSQHKQQKVAFHKQFIDLFKINESQFIDRYMSKLRQFSRIERLKKLKIFLPLGDIQKVFSTKNRQNIKEKYEILEQIVKKLSLIKTEQCTKEFSKAFDEMKKISQKNFGVNKISDLSKILNEQFIYQIKPKIFSIQLFWRNLSRLFKNQKVSKDLEQMKSSAENLYSKQFLSGKTFEIINGDTLQMPIHLLKSNQFQYEDKKIMVVGIFGPQSSGKSTLLNFLFGCDFLSSDGRCTSGIYGTYYEISGQNIANCEGFLILDTEGLFTNFKRKSNSGENFDNKLVLFLLKVCDILILNTLGDVDKNCQNILELSFDSKLMEYKQGVKYPNFYTVLNRSSGKIHQQQKTQINQLRKTILKVSPNMEKYMSLDSAISMPTAFNSQAFKQVQSSYLKSVQLKNKTPTQQFYNSTKSLTHQLMNMMHYRGQNSKNQARSLSNIYEDMDRQWSTILKHPILTKFATKQLKQFQNQISKHKISVMDYIDQLIDQWKQKIPRKLNQLMIWKQQKQKQSSQICFKCTQQFKKRYPQSSDPIRNNTIKLQLSNINAQLMDKFENFKLFIEQTKIKYQFDQSKDRGINSVSKMARQLRRINFADNKSLNNQQIQEKFKNSWYSITNLLTNKINRENHSYEKLKQIRQLYNSQLKINGFEYQISSSSDFPKSFDSTFQNYCQQINQHFTNKLKKKYLMYQDLSIVPIISTGNSGANQLKYKYLDMRKFFQLEDTRFNYYIKNKKLKQFVYQSKLQSQIQNQLMSCNLLKKFFKNLSQDIKYFQHSINCTQFLQSLIKYFKGGNNNKNFVLYKYHIIQNNYNNNKVISNKMYNLKKNGTDKIQYKFHTIQSLEIKTILQRNYNFMNHFVDLFSDQIKTIILEIIVQATTNFKKKNYNQYNQIKSMIKQQILLNATDQLNKIGLNLKQINYNEAISCEKHNQKPIYIKSNSQLMQLVSKLPPLINKVQIKHNIKDSYENGSINIAYLNSQKICVRKEFQNQLALKHYMNKNYTTLVSQIKSQNFKAFVNRHIQHQLLLQKIMQQITQMPKINIQNGIKKFLIVLNKQISDFNIDLKQISRQLSFNFISDLHDFSMHLFWKLSQTTQWERKNSILKNLKEEQIKQKKIFNQILNKDPNINCRASAKVLSQKYKQWILKQINHQKNKFIQKQTTLFLQNNTRESIQKIIDAKISNTNDQNYIFEYILNPSQTIHNYYNRFIQQKIQQINVQYKCSFIGCLNQLYTVIKDMYSIVQSNQAKLDSQQFFNQASDCQKQVKQIFLLLLLNGQTISHDYLANKFKLKQGVQFEVKMRLLDKRNKLFFNSANTIQFSISNYGLFLKHFLNQLQELKKEIQGMKQLKVQEIQIFKNKVQLILCPYDCPCCGKLCDIDMRKDYHHKLHKCQYGHQMRAIKGIVIEKNGKNYASILRCQDIGQSSSFRFNQKQYKWWEFKQQKKSIWSFEGQKKQIQSKKYKNMWEVCGKKFCQYIKQSKNIDMQYIDYSDGSIQFVQKGKIQKCQYVFSIDGSSSMRGSKWSDQLKSLKHILNDLSVCQQNTVSINVFTSSENLVFINTSPRKINVDTIKIPGGGTKPSAAFSGAIKAINRNLGNSNVHFLYISDGDGQYPQKQIQTLLQMKRKILQNKHQFEYTSILIGNGSGKDGMQLINKVMKGNDRYVSNAASLQNVFRQVLKTNQSKYNS